MDPGKLPGPVTFVRRSVSAFRDGVAVITRNGSAPTPVDVQTVVGGVVGSHCPRMSAAIQGNRY